MRRQELDGFIEGLFGHEEVVDIAERAHRGLDELGQMRALFEAVVHLVEGDAKQPTDKGIETTLRRMREMTKIAEHEIHAVVFHLHSHPKANDGGDANNEANRALAPWRARRRLAPVSGAIRKSE